MKELTWYEVHQLFTQHNIYHNITSKGQDTNKLIAAVVFKQSNFPKEYSEEQRTYVFTSDNKRFIANMGSNSVFGVCLDGSEYIRLDYYIHDWEVERCYLLEEYPEIPDRGY